MADEPTVEAVALLLEANGETRSCSVIDSPDPAIHDAIAGLERDRLGYDPSDVYCWVVERAPDAPGGLTCAVRSFHLRSAVAFDAAVAGNRSWSHFGRLAPVHSAIVPADATVELRFLPAIQGTDNLELVVGGEPVKPRLQSMPGSVVVLEFIGRWGGPAVLNFASGEPTAHPFPVDPVQLDLLPSARAPVGNPFEEGAKPAATLGLRLVAVSGPRGAFERGLGASGGGRTSNAPERGAWGKRGLGGLSKVILSCYGAVLQEMLNRQIAMGSSFGYVSEMRNNFTSLEQLTVGTHDLDFLDQVEAKFDGQTATTLGEMERVLLQKAKDAGIVLDPYQLGMIVAGEAYNRFVRESLGGIPAVRLARERSTLPNVIALLAGVVNQFEFSAAADEG